MDADFCVDIALWQKGYEADPKTFDVLEILWYAKSFGGFLKDIVGLFVKKKLHESINILKIHVFLCSLTWFHPSN